MLQVPFSVVFLQPPSRTLLSEASGDDMRGSCLRDRAVVADRIHGGHPSAPPQTGIFYRCVVDEGLSAAQHGCYSVGANRACRCAARVPVAEYSDEKGQHAGLHWVNQCRGAKEPRSGVLMRVLGCLKMRNRSQFRASYFRGVANTLADDISRWKHDEIALSFHSYRPEIY